MIMMKKMKTKNTTKTKNVILILGCIPLAGNTAEVTHQIKKGENLTKILYEYNLRPIYGKNSYIKKTIKLNKGKIKDNGNLIFKGHYIVLPADAQMAENGLKAPESIEAAPTEWPKEQLSTAGQESLETEETSKKEYALEAGFGAYVTELDGTGKNSTSKGELSSSLNYHAYLQGEMTVNENIFFLRTQYDRLTFKNTINSSREKSYNNLGFALGAKKRFSDFTLEGELSYAQMLGYGEITTTNIAINSSWVPALRIQGSQKLFDFSMASLGVRGFAGMALPNNADGLSPLYGASLYMEGINLGGNIFLHGKKLKRKDGEVKQLDIGLGVKYRLTFP